MTARHLSAQLLAHHLSRCEPTEIEGFLCRLTVTVDGYDERQADGVMSRIVKAADVGIGEVLDHRERGDRRWDSRQGDWAEVLFEMA